MSKNIQMERYLKKQIQSDLNEKMVFLAGPRQIGKTTLAKKISPSFDYMNWDIDADRGRILKKEYKKSSVLIFDEIHKFAKWRNYLKGLVDASVDQDQKKILVTGSARLDVLRKGGDSLQGRYHFLRMLPLTFDELKIKKQSDLLDLFQLSGFPEPYFSQSKTKTQRWSRSYRERLVRQDLNELHSFQDLGSIELLFDRLPDTVGGTLSINSLQEDLQISHKTISRWIKSLEQLYAIFRIAPFGPPQIKASKKEQKLFFFDWNSILDPGARFENFVAVHLLKWIFFEQDTQGRNLDLRFYRDKYGRELDFVILENKQPILFLEAKYSDSEISKGLLYLKNKYPTCKALQVHLVGQKEFQHPSGIQIIAFRNLEPEIKEHLPCQYC